MATIGPNSIIQTVRVLQEEYGTDRSDELLRAGGQAQFIDALPDHMIDEREFYRLVETLTEHLLPQEVTRIVHLSGCYTAEYLLQHRIPRPFQRLLAILPRKTALFLFLLAIRQHAWTFVGSGHFTFLTGVYPYLIISDPATPPPHIPPRALLLAACPFYHGTFQTLLQILIDQQVQVHALPPDAPDIRCAYALTF